VYPMCNKQRLVHEGPQSTCERSFLAIEVYTLGNRWRMESSSSEGINLGDRQPTAVD
jgi:hypothetical protein